MSSELQRVNWTSTQGTPNDTLFIDKLINYGSVLYQCYPLNHVGEISKRPHTFIYDEVEKVLVRDAKSIEGQLQRLMTVLRDGKFSQISKFEENAMEPFLDNGFFNGADAALGYAMIVDRQPSLIVEVGAGNSSKFFRRAARDYGIPLRMVAVDPAPRSVIWDICDTVIQKSVFDVDLRIFDDLRSGDVLFWDGSHLVSNGSDVTRLFLEIIPRLKSGVIIHMHDIFMPFEAALNGVVGDVSFPEQYLLATYLLYNKDFRVLLPVHYLQRKGAIEGWGGSFWFQLGNDHRP